MDDQIKASVLIVDDTPANIDILLEILDDGYDVTVATDGITALECVQENIPDIILLDVMMPEMDGYEVCSRLKAQEETKNIPIIFITAMTEIEDEIRGFEMGAVDYVTKPFSPPVVLKRVETALLLEQRNRELGGLARKLSKYLSPQVYNSIFQGDQDVVIQSQRKKLTIFFSDIVNFTSTTEGMEAEDLTDLLNAYLDEMSRIALKHGGTIDKFIGDAILIFFGDPVSRGPEEDALACVSMAIEMRERLEELHRSWYSYGVQNPFRVRAGISSGYCTVGNFGSKNRMDYTIIGTQVNIASRLESNAQPGQILISHETWSLVQDRIHCLKDKMISVKGISHPIQTYQVNTFLEESEDYASLVTAARFCEQSPFVEQGSSVEEAMLLLDRKSYTEPLIVTDEGRPVGIISKEDLQRQLDDGVSAPALMNRPLSELSLTETAVVDREWPLDRVIERWALRNGNESYDPVLVTTEGKLTGIIPAHRLIKQIIERKGAGL